MTSRKSSSRLQQWFFASFLVIGGITGARAQTLANDLVAYWPLDEVQGNKTPDLVSGYDMTLNNLTTNDLVAGISGNCFSFSNARQTMLSRVHSTSDDLPINKHDAFTVSLWTKVNGTGQNDLRVFSEGNTGISDPLFNLGTQNVDGTLALFIRQSGWTTVNHITTIAQPFDGQWHQIVFVQRADGTRTIYIDGVADGLAIPAKSAGTFNVNDTTIGGILRASPGFWVTGLIDEVALWKRAITQAEITQLKNEGLASIFPPLSKGLVSHWPMETVQGNKTPDLVSGYDMTLNNLTTNDLVAGIRGNCFSFSNARQTLLSRVHSAGEDLPINKHDAFTVSLWTKVNGTGQNDLRVFSEGNTGISDPLFNLGTHNVDGGLDVFIRQSGWTTVNHITTTAQPFDDQWHQIVFVQQADRTRTIYIDGVADGLTIPAKAAGTFNVNDTTIGGILRASPGFWVTGLIDEVALWKRGLTSDEINLVRTNGVPRVFTRLLPLEIKKFLADFPAVAQGDKVALRWEASKDASLSINPGIGDVSAQTQFGAGSLEVTVTNTTTFTLTASRGSETLTAQATVRTVPNVAANWKLVENFDFLTPGRIAGNAAWVNPEGVFSVVDLGANKVLGYQDGNALAALPLNSLTLAEGKSATLFFRVYVSPDDTASVLGVTFGLTERPIRFNGDFNGNVGPYVRLERLFDGATTDLLAHNGVGAVYDSAVDAIQPGNVYRVWIDVENRSFDVQAGVQNGGDVYAVHIQKEGDATRTTLFQNYVADRDAVNIDPIFGAPGTNLTHLFFAAIGANQGTNNVRFDDFYLSSNGFNSTTPVPPSSFQQVTTIQIGPVTYNRAAASFTLNWTSTVGATYNVLKKTSLSDPSWTTIATGYPTGGATGASTSFTDSNASQSAAFYLISQ